MTLINFLTPLSLSYICNIGTITLHELKSHLQVVGKKKKHLLSFSNIVLLRYPSTLPSPCRFRAGIGLRDVVSLRGWKQFSNTRWLRGIQWYPLQPSVLGAFQAESSKQFFKIQLLLKSQWLCENMHPIGLLDKLF